MALVPDHASHLDLVDQFLVTCQGPQMAMEPSPHQGHLKEKIFTSTHTLDLLQGEEECQRVHLPCEGHTLDLSGLMCQGPIWQLLTQVPCAQK